MPVFEYKALNSAGKSEQGIVDAESAKAARAKLRKKGLFPTDLAEEVAGHKKSAVVRSGTGLDTDVRKFFQRVPVQDVATMTRQLATLIGAGIPMIGALSALVEQVENERLKVVLSAIKEKVNEGSSLASAMKGHPKIFSDLYVNMIAAGEASGALDIVLRRLADFLEDQVELEGRIRGAMVYPSLMMFIAGIVIVFLVTFIVPQFEKIFDSMDVPLPIITRLLIGGSRVFSNWWWLVLPVFGIGGYLFVRWKRTEIGTARWDAFVLRAPALGRTLRMIAVSRFSRTLSTLLASGVPLISALNIVKAIVSNVHIAAAIENTRIAVQEGASIAAPLRASGQFPPLVTHMIATGEQTGELEGMLGKVADAYESEVRRRIAFMTQLLEPIMIILMAAVVVFIVAAILSPMLSMYTALQRQ